MPGSVKLWKVIGGEGKGGILVREGQSVKSTQFTERLSTGAKLLELNLDGGRLYYELLDGTGPKNGWVAIRLTDKELVVRLEEHDDDEAKELQQENQEKTQQASHGELSGAADVPWQLRPASEIASGALKPVEVLKPFLPAKSPKEAKEKAKLRRNGDMYGLPMPYTPEEFESAAYGADWLTKAFHAVGSIPDDTSVARIASAKSFPGGGSGPKTLFTIEYSRPDKTLDTTLFMKLPAEVGIVGSGTSTAQQRVQDMQGVFGDIWGAEIQFYRFVAPFIPFAVPKFYFGDLNRETQEAVIITTAVDWPKKGKNIFHAYEVMPPCEKCEDYTLQNSQDYYFALLRNLGRVAGLQKTGKLGPDIDKIHWSPYGPDPRGFPDGVFASFKEFVRDVAPSIWPSSVRSESFLSSLEEFTSLCQKCIVPIQHYIYSNPLYVGWGHQNGNTDNAYFYRNADGIIEAGVFDWGSAGHMAYAQEFMGSFGSCLGEMLAEYDDRLMHCFADAHNSTGAPEIDVDELILHYRLTMSASACQMLGMVLPYLSQKHPQGRPFWKEVKKYNEDKIRNEFALKFGVSMLYNRVLLLSLRMDAYKESIFMWFKRMGWA